MKRQDRDQLLRALHTLGALETKTSTGVKTPPDVRALGRAPFCDRRCDRVFVQRYGAQSSDAARGLRGSIRV